MRVYFKKINGRKKKLDEQERYNPSCVCEREIRSTYEYIQQKKGTASDQSFQILEVKDRGPLHGKCLWVGKNRCLLTQWTTTIKKKKNWF